jgi:hypothetical protein
VTIRNQKDIGFALVVSGATSGNGTAGGTPANPVGVEMTDSLTILGGSNGAEECSDLRSIRFAEP